MKLQLILGSAALLFAAEAVACSLAPIAEGRVRAKMLNAISAHFGFRHLPPSVLSEPKLDFAIPIEANCDGLHAAHHAAGFKFRSGSCEYKGLVVVMGYSLTNPAKVHGTRTCASINETTEVVP